MSLQFYRDNQLQYFKRKKEELQAIQTKVSLIRLRKNMMERQKLLNVQNEIRSLETQLSKSNNRHETVQRIQDRKNHLVNLFKEAAIPRDLYNIQ